MFRHAIVMIVAGFVAISPALASANAETEAAERAAMESLDRFMETFNSKDSEAWAASMHYPHVRIASGTVRVEETAQDMAAYIDFDAFAARFNWDHSAWDSREIIQSGPDKVHIAVRFSRYDKDGNVTKSFNSLYIVTKQGDHWGTQARSSFAP